MLYIHGRCKRSGKAQANLPALPRKNDAATLKYNRRWHTAVNIFFHHQIEVRCGGRIEILIQLLLAKERTKRLNTHCNESIIDFRSPLASPARDPSRSLVATSERYLRQADCSPSS
jgi:hypothetical protein